MNRNELYATAALLLALRLQQVATWQVLQAADDLKKLQRDIIRAILEADTNSLPRLSSRQKSLRELLAAIGELIDEVFAELARRYEEEQTELVAMVQKTERDRVLAFFGIDSGEPDVVDVAAMIIAGATMTDWFKRIGGDLKFRTALILNRAVETGEALEKTVARIRGNPPPPELPMPIIKPTLDGLAGIGRTAAEKIAQEGRTSVIEAAPKEELKEPPPGVEEDTTIETDKGVRFAWQQISILDSRTTIICRTYAFKMWTLNDYTPIGHALPFNGGVPRHINCRSSIVLASLDEAGMPDQTFATWARKQLAATLNSLFGERNVDLWRRGLMTDTELLRRGSPLDLAQFLALLDEYKSLTP